MTGDEVRGARFREKLRGYAPNEVDEALERIAAAMDAGQPLEGAELARIEFSAARFRGYHPDDVDDLLRRIGDAGA